MNLTKLEKKFSAEDVMINKRMFMLVTPDYKRIVRYLTSKELCDMLGVTINNLDMKLTKTTMIDGYVIAEE
jgi:hypothetical protein